MNEPFDKWYNRFADPNVEGDFVFWCGVFFVLVFVFGAIMGRG